MGLIKKRPRVRVSAPAVLAPGESFEATLIVEADRPVPVNAITVELNGFEEVRVGARGDALVARNQVAALAGTVSGNTELQKGVRHYPFTFQLPEDAPPTFLAAGTLSEHVRVDYSYDVRIDIPWWPDRRASFTAVVGYASPYESQPEPAIAESGPLDVGGHLEVSLASDVVAPGEEISGAIALGNRASVNYREIEVALVSDCVRTIRSQTQSDEFSRLVSRLRVPSTDGTLEFRKRVPATIFPSFHSLYWSLLWAVEVTARVIGGPDVVARLPVRVEPSPSNKPRRRLAPPLVGRERIESVWREVAERHGLELQASVLNGRVGDCELTISRRSSNRGPLVVAELTYPDLRLGLTTRKRLFAARELAGRDEGQIGWFVALLPDAGDLELDASDETLRLIHRGAGQDEQWLDGFIDTAMTFARAIPKPGDVPVAEAMKPRLAAWRELANLLEGKLNVGDLSVSGKLGGCGVEVRHHWPRRGGAITTLSAWPPGALRTPNVELKWDEDKGATLKTLADRLVLEVPLQLDAALLVPKLRALAKLARNLT